MKKFVIAAMLLPILGLAQSSDLGNWLIYIGSKKLNSKWNIHHEVQYRNYNAIGDLEQLLLRTGIGYNLTENNNNILFGYGYILSENYVIGDEKEAVNEHRIYQQFTTKQSAGRFSWGHRYRFEQRWVEDTYKMRLRYFLNARVALNKPTLEAKTFYLSGYNEIFMDTNKSTAFDRNRLYGGLGYQLNKNIKLELGYMNQFKASSNSDQMNVVVLASF